MKTIFRFANVGLMAAVIALGALAASAQNPCEDAAGMTTSGDEVRELFKDKSVAGRKKFVEAGKTFKEKYGSCEPAKELADWLTGQIPKTEEAIKKMEAEAVENALVARFDTALKTKNWDEVYAAGKEALAKYPEKYRTAEIVLAALGGEEALKGNAKYNDDALKFAKQSIADLEAGKPFLVGTETKYGLASVKDGYNFAFITKEDAIGWMNLYIGYITQVSQKNKAAAAPYLFKATQGASESAKNPIPYELVGFYYFDQLDKLTEEIKVMVADQKDGDPEDVAKAKVAAIKAKVALANGTSERAMEAFSKAYTLGNVKAYKDKMYKNIENAYNLRFGKEKGGMDAWIAEAAKRPFQNPLTPVTPVSDPEPVTTSTTSTSSTPIKP